MSNYLAISILGACQKARDEIIKLTALNGGNIEKSRMTVLEDDISMAMCVSGHWSSIAKIESALTQLANVLDIKIYAKRTRAHPRTEKSIYYTMQFLTIDKVGIIKTFSDFFTTQGIIIENINSDTHLMQNTKMLNVMMHLRLPEWVHIGNLRDAFMLFCEEQNVDADLDPLRG